MRAILLLDDDQHPGAIAQALAVLGECAIRITALPSTTLDMAALRAVGLSDRQCQIVAIGHQVRWDYQAMGETLGYTIGTVRYYMCTIFRCVGVRSRQELARVMRTRYTLPVEVTA